MLEENKTEDRIARHKVSQEDFTPEEIVEMLYKGSEEVFSNFDKTILDPCAGICYILIYCLKKRLENCKDACDIIKAISTIRGTELYEDNIIEGREGMINAIKDHCKEKGIDLSFVELMTMSDILYKNIVCTDMFKWDYKKWKPIEEEKSISLF